MELEVVVCPNNFFDFSRKAPCSRVLFDATKSPQLTPIKSSALGVKNMNVAELLPSVTVALKL